MHNFGLTFHHLGLAVTHKDKALNFVTGLGYQTTQEVYDHFQNVNLIMCISDTMPDIEIIYKAKTIGPLNTILKNHAELIYHICYQTNDIQSSVHAIKQSKNRLITISSIKPAILFNNNYVGFYMLGGFGLIELLEKD